MDYKLPEFPKEAGYLWQMFHDLRHACGDDLTPVQMQAFFSLRGVEPAPFEVETIQQLIQIMRSE